jgi:hypothetical protein
MVDFDYTQLLEQVFTPEPSRGGRCARPVGRRRCSRTGVRQSSVTHGCLCKCEQFVFRLFTKSKAMARINWGDRGRGDEKTAKYIPVRRDMACLARLASNLGARVTSTWPIYGECTAAGPKKTQTYLTYYGWSQTTAPTTFPTPAVTAMASAPQNVTRQALIHRPAPPTLAAATPSSARKAREVAET